VQRGASGTTYIKKLDVLVSACANKLAMITSLNGAPGHRLKKFQGASSAPSYYIHLLRSLSLHELYTASAGPDLMHSSMILFQCQPVATNHCMPYLALPNKNTQSQRPLGNSYFKLPNLLN